MRDDDVSPSSCELFGGGRYKLTFVPQTAHQLGRVLDAGVEHDYGRSIQTHVLQGRPPFPRNGANERGGHPAEPCESWCATTTVQNYTTGSTTGMDRRRPGVHTTVARRLTAVERFRLNWGNWLSAGRRQFHHRLRASS